MDHRQLLEKYIAHVRDVENGDFMELINTPFSSVKFTEDEIGELQEIISEGRMRDGRYYFSGEKH